MMGMGVLPKKHPLNFGMLGNNGKPYANRAVGRADLLIVVGARIADRAIPKPENLTRRAVIHIDIDTAEIGKNVGPTVPLVGDLLLEYHSDPESYRRLHTGNEKLWHNRDTANRNDSNGKIRVL